MYICYRLHCNTSIQTYILNESYRACQCPLSSSFNHQAICTLTNSLKYQNNYKLRNYIKENQLNWYPDVSCSCQWPLATRVLSQDSLNAPSTFHHFETASENKERLEGGLKKVHRILGRSRLMASGKKMLGSGRRLMVAAVLVGCVGMGIGSLLATFLHKHLSGCILEAR